MSNIKGAFVYRNIMVQQHENIFESFKKLFMEKKPKRVIEIGTSHGGLTLLLRDLLDSLNLNDSDLISYDKDKFHYLDDYILNGVNIDFRHKNLFNHMYNDLEKSEEISNLIKKEGVTIVLCDGGSKKNEFRILSNLIKKGDIIMGHDYSPNKIFFEEEINNKIWNWLELTDEDINDSCLQNNLFPYMDEEFRKVVWVCKEKK